MANKTLSICIPTFNRKTYLRECLDSVISASKDFSDRVSIIVSDNDSSDGTQQMMDDYLKTYSNIYYYKNDFNIGPEKNFYAAALKAKGDFVWIVGDDDTICQDSISKLIDKINQEYNLIICNYSILSKDLSTPLNEIFYDYKSFDLNDHDQLLKEFGANLGFISSVVFEKQLFFAASHRCYHCLIL